MWDMSSFIVGNYVEIIDTPSKVLSYSFTPKPWDAPEQAKPLTLQIHSFYLIIQNPECFYDNELVSYIQKTNPTEWREVVRNCV
jgi:hypothetical protein